jgi:hypothetical protein
MSDFVGCTETGLRLDIAWPWFKDSPGVRISTENSEFNLYTFQRFNYFVALLNL